MLTAVLGTATVASAATVPGAPTIGAATRGNKSVTLHWTAPASNGGSTITAYVVRPVKGLVAQPEQTFASNATTQVITGLTNGASYTFRVKAKNAVGAGAYSALSIAVTPATTPGVPTIGAVTRGIRSVTLSWTAPVSTGGSAITGYTVMPYIGIYPQPWKGFVSTATTQVVTGLTNGVTYTFKVKARNAVGPGAYSGSSAAVTLDTVPSAPRMAAVTNGNASVTLHWSTPTSDGRRPITGYTVQTTRTGQAVTVKTFNSTATTQVMTGLENRIVYGFRVSAQNAVGSGPYSAWVYVTPSNCLTAPSAPAPGIDWRSCQLSAANLTGANLTGANLTYTNLVGANLTNANLSGANLTGAYLNGANLTGTNLSGATMTGAYLTGANLAGTNLSGTTMTGITTGELTGTPAALPAGWALYNGYLMGPGAILTGAPLSYADLTGADLSGADLTYAELDHATLTGADLAGANLAYAYLDGVISGGITGTPTALPTGWTLVGGFLVGP